jgi:hypothetical protein
VVPAPALHSIRYVEHARDVAASGLVPVWLDALRGFWKVTIHLELVFCELGEKVVLEPAAESIRKLARAIDAEHNRQWLDERFNEFVPFLWGAGALLLVVLFEGLVQTAGRSLVVNILPVNVPAPIVSPGVVPFSFLPKVPLQRPLALHKATATSNSARARSAIIKAP